MAAGCSGPGTRRRDRRRGRARWSGSAPKDSTPAELISETLLATPLIGSGVACHENRPGIFAITNASDVALVNLFVRKSSFRGFDEAKRPVYLLDLYARSAEPVTWPIDRIIEWHREAHRIIRKAFDGSITEKCRAHFGIGKA